jgi:lysophospholipase L1-like esterase
MKNMLSILLSFVALCGCAKKADVNKSIDLNGIYVNPAANYLALGDSYTVGQGVPLDQSFPYQLARQLGKPNPTIIAATGWTTSDLRNAIDQANIGDKKHDAVTLLIGVNDQFQGVSSSVYATNFTSLLNTAITFAKSPKNVVVMSIPDYSVTPFAASYDVNKIAAEIDQFNNINKEITQAAGVNYLDITDISRQAKSNLNLLANDRLHPSVEMYKLWVNRLEPLVRVNLNK